MAERMGASSRAPDRVSAGSATASRSTSATATLHAVRPPVYDSPTTRGLFDPTTGVYWTSDSFATPMLTPVRDVDEIDDELLGRGHGTCSTST